MNIAFYEYDGLKHHYTYRQLQYLALCGGVNYSRVEEADVILISISNPRMVSKALRAKKINKKAKIIMGGCESFCGENYLGFVDGVVVGMGFDFFKWLGEHKDDCLTRFWDCFEALPYTLTLNKIDSKITPSYYIDWDKVIVVNVRRKNYYYLAATGCPNKCHFCFTSWTQPYQTNDFSRIKHVCEQVRREVGKGAKITLVANEGSVFKGKIPGLASKSVTVKDYLKHPSWFDNAGLLHIGIERFKEEDRQKWGKPISNEELTRLFKLSKKHNIKLELFFILADYNDLDNDYSEFINSIPEDKSLYPAIFCKFTWLDFRPHTPLWSCNIPRKVQEFNSEEFFIRVQSKNRRVRCFPARSSAYNCWNTLFSRCTPSEALKVYQLRGINDRAKLMSELDKLGLMYILTRPKENMPNRQIKPRLKK